MVTKNPKHLKLTERMKSSLMSQPGLTVMDLASRLEVNRQFMSGFLSALEEHGEVYHRQVGPARIYFLVDQGPK